LFSKGIVTEARSGQSKADAVASRAAKKAAEEADEERVAKELRTRRTMQLENSQAAVKKLEGELQGCAEDGEALRNCFNPVGAVCLQSRCLLGNSLLRYPVLYFCRGAQRSFMESVIVKNPRIPGGTAVFRGTQVPLQLLCDS